MRLVLGLVLCLVCLTESVRIASSTQNSMEPYFENFEGVDQSQLTPSEVSELITPELDYRLRLVREQLRLQTSDSSNSQQPNEDSLKDNRMMRFQDLVAPPTITSSSSTSSLVKQAQESSGGSSAMPNATDSNNSTTTATIPTKLAPCIPEGHTIDSAKQFLPSLPKDLADFLTSLKPCSADTSPCMRSDVVIPKEYENFVPVWLRNAPPCPVLDHPTTTPNAVIATGASIASTASSTSSGIIVPDHDNSTFNSSNPSQNTPNVVAAVLSKLKTPHDDVAKPEDKILNWASDEVQRVQNENRFSGPILTPKQRLVEYNEMGRVTHEKDDFATHAKAVSETRINELNLALKDIQQKARRAAAHVTFLKNTTSLITNHVNDMTKRMSTLTNASMATLLSEEWKYLQSNLRLQHQKKLLEAVKSTHRSVNNSYSELVDFAKELHSNSVPSKDSEWNIKDFEDKDESFRSQVEKEREKNEKYTQLATEQFQLLKQYQDNIASAKENLAKLTQQLHDAKLFKQQLTDKIVADKAKLESLHASNK